MDHPSIDPDDQLVADVFRAIGAMAPAVLDGTLDPYEAEFKARELVAICQSWIAE